MLLRTIFFTSSHPSDTESGGFNIGFSNGFVVNLNDGFSNGFSNGFGTGSYLGVSGVGGYLPQLLV